MKRSRHQLLLLLALASASTAALDARAEVTASERTMAESLFREGKRLMKEGDYAAACPKLAESQRLDPGGGTLLNLAVCHENEGRTATAWAEFREALAQARSDGRAERVELARQHIEDLEPRLSRLEVRVPDASRLDGLRVSVDGEELPAAGWGTGMPVDPGEHVVEVAAPGREPWKQRVTTKASATVPVEVPVLAPAAQAPSGSAPAPAPAAPEASAEKDDGAGRRTIGYVAAGLGVVGLGVGTVFGLRAISKRSQSDDECPGNRCTQKGVDLNEDAKSAATASNIALGLGIVGVGVGAYLIFSAGGSEQGAGVERSRAASLALAPAVGPGAGGLFVSGSW